MGRCTPRLWALIGILASAAVPLTATSVIPPTFENLVDSATDIFVGDVASLDSRWVNSSSGAVIFTYVTFDIEESLKGTGRGQTTLQFRGGTVGDVTLQVTDMPQFRVGDRDVIFVGDRTAVSPLVGFMHGRFKITRDATNGTDRVATHDGRPLVSTAALGKPNPAGTGAAGVQAAQSVTAGGLSLPTLRSEISNRLRSRGAVR